jgi:hypothetical protein
MQSKLTIEDLLVDDTAKQTLGMIARIANSDREIVRETVPSLFVTAEAGAGVFDYGNMYGKIIETSPLLQVRGSATFIELVFPKNNPQDEKLFFSSPQRAASIRNRFYGTMLISFEEYEGHDLIKSDSFKRLIDFIDCNKANIHFVFHVMPDFMAKSQLVSALRSHINIVEVNLDTPDIEKSYMYTVSELKKDGYIIDDTIKQQFIDCILNGVVTNKEYLGYSTLNNLLNRIRYEIAVSDKTDGVIDKNIVDRLLGNFVSDLSGVTDNSQIGFHI